MIQNKLFYYRRARGLRQYQLAERLGISEVRVSRIETGRTVPTPELSGKISELLGVAVDDVFPKSHDKEGATDAVIND
jgi:transcriptional regulator with XRE-family HTH domain